MDLTRLERIIDAYGAAPERWPADERAEAEALTQSEPRAQALLAEARALDAMLDQYAVPAPSPELIAAILSTPPRPTLSQLLGELFGLQRFTWRPAAALVAAAMFGLTIGAVGPTLYQTDTTTVTTTASDAGAEDADWLTFALGGDMILDTEQ